MGVNPRIARGSGNHARGGRAEWLAMWYLRLKGYRILARRWRCPAGEIDLIAAKRGLLVAVEVKARPTLEEGLAAILPKQRARLEQALLLFAARRPGSDLRLDALVVLPRRWPHHLKNAWQAD